MFDFALSKMAVIGVVSLVVLGPERLPRVVRTSGALFGRAQRYIHSVREEVTREIELAEFRQAAQQAAASARLLESSIRDGIGEIDASAKAVMKLASSAPTSDPVAENPRPQTTLPMARSNEVIDLILARRRRWRGRQVTLPQWYKRASARRRKVTSDAASVARAALQEVPGLSPREASRLCDPGAGEPA
ncbi:Sec-independent protein translocase subunit TatB [Burkholderia sp. Ax-1719]|uniref:Sec-independent protein translocase subunit TatB n=1 Tax=Burkholderia sp. Ax-1719 TaxID=2608334 RepID=UPI00141D9620|nr:Sec-independent protein translocase subunit TatB [Burkholderia sp. Ax-1719]NIE65255.1 Sec-independent protein translocase subunit TatB [Burkholderia sp. Ax-1719]